MSGLHARLWSQEILFARINETKRFAVPPAPLSDFVYYFRMVKPFPSLLVAACLLLVVSAVAQDIPGDSQNPGTASTAPIRSWRTRHNVQTRNKVRYRWVRRLRQPKPTPSGRRSSTTGTTRISHGNRRRVRQPGTSSAERLTEFQKFVASTTGQSFPSTEQICSGACPRRLRPWTWSPSLPIT